MVFYKQKTLFSWSALNDLCKLQSVIKTLEKIIGTSLSSLENLKVSKLNKKKKKKN